MRRIESFTQQIPKFLAIVFLVTLPLSAPAQVYSDRSLHGAYAFSFDGTVPGPGSVRLPIAGIMHIVFDGKGAFTADSLDSVPGPTGNVVTATELVGTYTVNPDGTFQVSQERFLAGTNLGVKLSDETVECAILEVSQEFRCMSTMVSFLGVGPVPVMVSGRGSKQHGKNFSQQDFRGNYSIAFLGTVFIPDPTPFRSIGTFFADGAGNITAMSPFFNNIGGLASALPALPGPSLTYTVDSRGFVDIQAPNVQNPPGTKVGEAEFACLLAGRGKGLRCMFASNSQLIGSVLVGVPTIAQGTWKRLSRNTR